MAGTPIAVPSSLFLKGVESGLVAKGSLLLVENLDRLSRQEPLDAIDVFRKLLDAGIEIHTLTDGQRYRRKSIRLNPAQLFIITAIFMRAHEESKTKSERGGEAWEAKRRKARAGTPIHGHNPGWIDVDAAGKLVLNQERAAVVRQIMEWAKNGPGPLHILVRLRGVPTFSKRGKARWDVSTLKKLLTSWSLIGEYQPAKCVRGQAIPQGDPVPGYYPAVITPAVFYAVQRVVKSRRRGARGATGGRVHNLFGQVLTHGKDRSTMRLKTNMAGTTMVSSAYIQRAVDTSPSFPYPVFERAFLCFVAEVDLSPAQKQTHDNVALIDAELGENSAKAVMIREQLLASSAKAGGSLADMLAQLDEQRGEIIAQRLGPLPHQATPATSWNSSGNWTPRRGRRRLTCARESKPRYSRLAEYESGLTAED